MLQGNGIADGGVDTVGEAQWVSGRTVHGVTRIAGRMGQVQLPAELREYVSAHGFWKRGTTAMSDI